MTELASPGATAAPPLTQLTSAQRRVLGALLEKAFTTPEAYPLTLKATTTACNQKSNRDPVVEYDEDFVEQVLDQLRELGLAAIVHTEGGRSARFRHYMRQRFSFSEIQLAILTELMLRGRQQVGELRSRASRMVPIDSLDVLRRELSGLIAQQVVQANGALERRGVEVDHCLYTLKERRPMQPLSDTEPAEAPHATRAEAVPMSVAVATPGRVTPPTPSAPDVTQRLGTLESALETLRGAQVHQQAQLSQVLNQLEELQRTVANLRQELGG